MGSDPLPTGWTKRVRSSVLHAIALAAAALTVARARAGSRGIRADLERAEHEIALLREELDLKDSRWTRLAPRRRPHYNPIQRMRILQLKAARGWSCDQAAARLMIDEQTLKSWLRRVDEAGDHALVRLTEPVNRFPGFVRYLIRQLKTLCPTMGKVRVAQTLARVGLHLSATTAGRVLRETDPAPDDLELPVTICSRRVIARKPGDLWHIDLTAVPTGAGFWVPWLPFSLPQRWPFCWWVLVVVERFIPAMKTECTSRILVPLADESMHRELALYAIWYNEHRPHQALDGRTPNEMLRCEVIAPEFDEPATPQPVRLKVACLEGRPHLPIVQLQQVA